MSAKYLSRIEIGKENPSIDLLLRLADGLEVEPYEMLCFEDGEPVRQLRGEGGEAHRRCTGQGHRAGRWNA